LEGYALPENPTLGQKLRGFQPTRLKELLGSTGVAEPLFALQEVAIARIRR
jgi:hypothetical protein